MEIKEKDTYIELFMRAVCFNRQQMLKVLTSLGPSSESKSAQPITCRGPPRSLTNGWPYYIDNTLFGEGVSAMKEILTVDGEEDSWDTEVASASEEDAPEGGWLKHIYLSV